MRAIVCTKYGPPELLQLREMPKPQPKDGEILVKVHTTTVGPADIAFLRAQPFITRFFSGFLAPRQPIPGTAFSGTVEDVGRGVRDYCSGDEVFGSTVLALGACAEYLCMPTAGPVARKPPNISHVEAAGICDGGTTALTFLRDQAKVRSGQSVLVNGASGAVGAAAVQLARYFGAEVTGVCSGANVELVRSLGAHRVIDYTQQDFTRCGERWNVIFDAVGKSSFARCKDALTANGIYLLTVPTLAIALQMGWTSLFGGKKAIFAATGLGQTQEKLQFLAELMGSGAIREVVDRCYALEEIVAACQYVETGRKKGDVVIVVAPDTGAQSQGGYAYASRHLDALRGA
jgi:NADPH:quinone reductase-like Zn-dependent oxidoreductase